MTKCKPQWIFLFAIGGLAVGAFAISSRLFNRQGDALAKVRKLATAAYIRQMDVESFMRRGSDFTNPYYSPLRLGKSLKELDIVYDYDFARLEAVRKRLANVDRRAVLTELFKRICAGCTTNKEKHLAVLEFCNKASFHNRIQPMWPNKTAVFDPLILLELGEMRCGAVARLVVDLFDAGGYRGRLVQAGHHVSSEVYYEGDWHYIDAGLYGGRQTVYDEDGTIPSYVELSKRPFALDAMPTHLEPNSDNEPTGNAVYPSWFHFSKQSYRTPPMYYVKTSTRAQERKSRHYGWEYFRQVRDNRRVLGDFDRKYEPSVAGNLRRHGGKIMWDAASDKDGDLVGYRVYLGSRSRGWCYGPNWKPDMYDAKFHLPPGDVAVIETKETQITLPETRPVYVTVMSVDQHGVSVGRTLFPMSIELVVPETTHEPEQ